LEDEQSGFKSDLFIVRRVNKDSLVDSSSGSSISHLHRIALQSRSNPNLFLALTSEASQNSDELVSSVQCVTPKRNQRGEPIIHDLMLWTIVGVTKSEAVVSQFD